MWWRTHRTRQSGGTNLLPKPSSIATQSTVTLNLIATLCLDFGGDALDYIQATDGPPIAEIDCRVHDGVPRHVPMDPNNAVYYLLTEVGTALWRTAGADANIKAVGSTASYSR
jgi:hypothetical protein